MTYFKDLVNMYLYTMMILWTHCTSVFEARPQVALWWSTARDKDRNVLIHTHNIPLGWTTACKVYVSLLMPFCESCTYSEPLPMFGVLRLPVLLEHFIKLWNQEFYKNRLCLYCMSSTKNPTCILWWSDLDQNMFWTYALFLCVTSVW